MVVSLLAGAIVCKDMHRDKGPLGSGRPFLASNNFHFVFVSSLMDSTFSVLSCINYISTLRVHSFNQLL